MGAGSKGARVYFIGGAAVVAISAVAFPMILGQCGGSSDERTSEDGRAPPASGADAGPELPAAERAARKAAAAPLDEQSPSVKRRYYKGRLRAAKQALETHERLVTKLREARQQLDAGASPEVRAGSQGATGTDGGTQKATDRAAALKERIAKAEVRVQQRRDELEELQAKLRALPE